MVFISLHKVWKRAEDGTRANELCAKVSSSIYSVFVSIGESNAVTSNS